MQGEGAGSTHTALETNDILLAGTGTGFLNTAAETLLQVTSVLLRPPLITVTGNTVGEASVTLGALITFLPTKPNLALALAGERMASGAHRALVAAVAGLAAPFLVPAPVLLLTVLTLQSLSMRRAEALSRYRVTTVLSMSAVTGCTATILVCIEAV